MSNLSKRYSHEFKESIVSLHQTGRSANSLSKEYGVSVSSITLWIKQADSNDTSVLSVNEKQLIKENKRLKAENDILKPSGGAFGKKLIDKGREVVLKVIRNNLNSGHLISFVLRCLKVPRSTYYAFLNWKPGQRLPRRTFVKEKVLSYWLESPIYGYPRLTKTINHKHALDVSRRLVHQLMCELGIRSRMVKKINKPKSYVTEAQRPNLVKKKVDQLNVLLTDITYIRVKQKWFYLASLYNPRTRRVIAHKVSGNMTKELATSVIEKTKIKQLGINIIHSDMGSQYTSDLFEKTLVQYGVKHSYSRKGCPGDNARIESFHSILKREYTNAQSFESIHEVIAGIGQYIRWYNNERISLVA
ncbi:IS3 family transposase [Staphylococcus intermedius]|uniref:IS3 family transposase n=1 Tax=Staphylococcus intermedius TaxID=1285 RepID=UPI001157B5D0|nr:IS3 family transposase [Staphylococcus intermedius]